MHRLLIVHSDSSLRALMSSMLQSAWACVEEAESDRAAARMLEHMPVDLVIAGVEDDSSEALELVSLVRRKSPRTPVMLFSPAPRPDQMREASQRGAAAFLKFPLPASQLRAAVAQALPEVPPAEVARVGAGDRFAAAGSSVPAYQSNGYGNGNGNGTQGRFGGAVPSAALRDASAGIVNHFSQLGVTAAAEGAKCADPECCESLAHDPTMRQVFDLADAIAPRRSPVLIIGEHGTGKKALARWIHRRSAQQRGVFRVFDCQSGREQDLEAALAGHWLESEGADSPDSTGAMPTATLFLNEVQSLSPALQATVLRAVRDAERRTNSGDHSQVSTPRLIPGCSEELGPLVERGQFRSDLYYSLSAVTLQLPPLRHRGEDIMRLAEHFRELTAHANGKSIVGISPEACRRLTSHEWPENVAELKGVIERAVARCRGHWIEPNHLSLDSPVAGKRDSLAASAARHAILPLKEALEEPEKRLILEALKALNWNRQETARVLDINRTTLYKKMKKYGLIFDEPVWSN